MLNLELESRMQCGGVEGVSSALSCEINVAGQQVRCILLVGLLVHCFPNNISVDNFFAPSSTIVRKRGAKFHPGQHVSPLSYFPFITFDSLLMGRDHILPASVPGYIHFSVQASGRFSRKYVGLVLNRGERLPLHEAAYERSQ
jgi:ribosomal protein L27